MGGRQVNPVELDFGVDPVRCPEHHQHRLLGGIGALHLGDHGAFRTTGNGLQRQTGIGNQILGAGAPVSRIGDQAALWEGLGGAERLGAFDQRIGGRQARALFFHVRRVDPAFARRQAQAADLDDVAGFDGLGKDIADIVVPDFRLQMQVALGDGGKLRHGAGGDILNVVTGLLEQFAGDMGGDVLSGPFVDGDLDRVIGFGGNVRRSA